LLLKITYDMLTVLTQAHMCTLDLQPPMQSVPITTKAVSSNHDHDNVYSTRLYVIKLSMICGRSMVFSGYSDFLYQ